MFDIRGFAVLSWIRYGDLSQRKQCAPIWVFLISRVNSTGCEASDHAKNRIEQETSGWQHSGGHSGFIRPAESPVVGEQGWKIGVGAHPPADAQQSAHARAEDLTSDSGSALTSEIIRAQAIATY
ncbi:unnamed protein product [Nesidiocoris tenuis]|uniref:Uncharacterized protein n=1 Tax=Nesidiocoris tenuis TaxID=355587 RepID=A0A6H5GYI0_9HEMI|nr:unnamed protein product [Nesidiocoris tenuis]